MYENGCKRGPLRQHSNLAEWCPFGDVTPDAPGSYSNRPLRQRGRYFWRSGRFGGVVGGGKKGETRRGEACRRSVGTAAHRNVRTVTPHLHRIEQEETEGRE